MDLRQELQRRQGDKTQEEFAAEIGVVQSTLSRIYSGRRNIGLDVAQKIAATFPDLRQQIAEWMIPPEQEEDCSHSLRD